MSDVIGNQWAEGLSERTKRVGRLVSRPIGEGTIGLEASCDGRINRCDIRWITGFTETVLPHHVSHATDIRDHDGTSLLLLCRKRL